MRSASCQAAPTSPRFTDTIRGYPPRGINIPNGVSWLASSLCRDPLSTGGRTRDNCRAMFDRGNRLSWRESTDRRWRWFLRRLGDAIEGTMDRWNEGSDRSIDRPIDPADTTPSNEQVTQSNLYRIDKLPLTFNYLSIGCHPFPTKIIPLFIACPSTRDRYCCKRDSIGHGENCVSIWWFYRFKDMANDFKNEYRW